MPTELPLIRSLEKKIRRTNYETENNGRNRAADATAS